MIPATQALREAADDFEDEATALEELQAAVPGATSWDTTGFIRGIRAIAVALRERADDLDNEKPLDTFGTRSWVNF